VREWDEGDGGDVDRVAGKYGSGFERKGEVRMDTAVDSLDEHLIMAYTCHPRAVPTNVSGWTRLAA